MLALPEVLGVGKCEPLAQAVVAVLGEGEGKGEVEGERKDVPLCCALADREENCEGETGALALLTMLNVGTWEPNDEAVGANESEIKGEGDCRDEGEGELVEKALGVREPGAGEGLDWVVALCCPEALLCSDVLRCPEGLGEDATEGVRPVLREDRVEGEARAVELELGEGVRRGELLAGGEAELFKGVGVKRVEGERSGEGERVKLVLVEGVQVGGRDKPVVVQPPQGQGMGAPLPGGQ